MDRPPVAAAVDSVGAADVTRCDAGSCAALLVEIGQVRGWLDAVEARVTSRLIELSATTGSAPAADVHVRVGRTSAAEGRRKERRAATLDRAPHLAEALSEGRVGAEHVDALAAGAAALPDEHRSALFGHSQQLADVASHATPEQFGRHVRSVVRAIERAAGVDRERRRRRETFLLRRHNMATGMIEGRFAFHPELAAQIFGAVDREVAAMVADGERRGDPEFVERDVNRSRLAAEALGRLVAGGHQQIRPLEADLTVIVDVRTLLTGEVHDHGVCESGEGFELPPASVRRLVCNGTLTPIVVDTNGVVLHAGRSLRHANRAQRRALRAMYRTCAIDECDVPFDRCEVHHIDWFERGGLTDLDNLVPLCARHHHAVHDLGWRLRLEADRTLVVVTVDGDEVCRCRPDIRGQLVGTRPAGRSVDAPPGRQPAA